MLIQNKRSRMNFKLILLFAFIIISLCLLFSFSSASLSLNLPTQTISNSYLKSTLITQESDSNSDGVPDVITNFTQINDTLIEIYVKQTNPKGAYKWQSALFNIQGLTNVQKMEYNPATQVWTNTGNLVPFNYQYTTKWNVSGNYTGFSLFGSGSGDKRYRLILPAGNKTFKIFTGSASEEIIYSWINNTFTIHPVSTYEVQPFQISIYDCNGNKFTTPNVNWTTNYSSDDKIVFYPMLGITNLSCIRFRTNTLESEPQLTQQGNQFQPTQYSSYHLTFETFEAKNNLTSRNVTEVHPTFIQSFIDTFPAIWRIFSYQQEVLYYEIEYRGQIVDLDPELSLTITNTNYDAIQFNQTEGSNIGARLQAAVLSMDFNQAPESKVTTIYNCSISTGCDGTYTKDGSIYNNYGTTSGYTSDTAWRNVGSKINNSLQFDGGDDYINVGSVPSIGSISQSMTVSAWVYLNNNASRGDIVTQWTSGTTNSKFDLLYGASGSTAKPQFYVTDGTAGGLKSSGAASTALWNNQWYFLTGVFDSNLNQTFIYVNGLLENYTNTSIILNTASITSLQIGRANNVASPYYFNGSIDDVIIWGRALNATEINQIYQEGLNSLTVSNTTIPNQVAHFRLDELTGTSSLNDMNASANGTLTNYPATSTITSPVYNATGGVNGSGAYVFDGTNDYITTQNVGALGNVFTVSAWVNMKTTSTRQTIYANSLDDTAGAFILEAGSLGSWYANSIAVTIPGTVVYVARDNTINSNEWKHIIYTRNGTGTGTHSVYVNGVKAGDWNNTNTPVTATNYVDNTKSKLIGARTTTTQFFNGSIDNVQIFNRALSAQEVLALYNGTLANRTIKYSTKQGDFTSGVFYNTTQTYWNISLVTADTTNRSGLVNADNSINISNPNLVSYWALDGNYLDATGRNNGTGVAGTSGLNNASGISSGAIKFDGVDDYVNNEGIPNFGANANVTISLWAYPLTSGTTTLLLKGSGGVCYAYGLGLSSGYLKSIVSSNDYTVGSGVNTNQWNHLVIVYNSSGAFGYVNGVYGANSSASAIVTCTNLNITIGKRLNAGSPGNFNGTIDEVLIYNTSLTQAQITQLYKSGLSQHANTNVTIQTRTANTYNTTDPSLVAFWALNEDSNTTVIDETGVNNGTYLNGALSNLSSGIVGSGGYFFGTNQTINITDNTNMSFPNTVFTVSAWFNAPSSTAIRTLIAKDGGATGFGWALNINGSGSIVGVLKGSGGNLAASRATTQTGFANNQWHHVVVVYQSNTTAAAGNNISNIYVDGVSYSGTQSSTTAYIAPTLPITIGVRSGTNTQSFNGLIDEVRIYNRSLSASEVLNLYQLGSYHISDWTNWSASTVVNDGQGQITSASGKFMQFKSNLNTNDTDVSPYVNSYNVTPFIISNFAPSVTWLSQTPADINTQVIFENSTLIVYNITDTDGVNPLNTSNVTFFWKVNTTNSNAIQFFLNGSSYQALAPGMVNAENFFNRKSQWTNVSDNWTQTMNANEFLPGTYNINEFVMETTPHNRVTLTNTDDTIFVELLNVNNETQYNFFEIMVNSTANAAPLQFYYCNSTYNPNVGGKVTTSPYCHLFNTLLNNESYNHVHSNYTSHQTISMFINSTTGSTNSLKVTPRGYFIARMSGGTGDWYVYYITNTSRQSATKTSINAGTSWTNQTFTIDSHLHQFYNDSYLRYYACASDTAGLSSCSNISTDSLELGNLPPTAPIVYSPSAGSLYEDGVIPINWTAAESPNGYAITHYNVSLWNTDNTFNMTLIANTSNLGYIWNGTNGGGEQMYGTWVVHVMAYDINNLTSVGVSGNFTRAPDLTVPFIQILKPFLTVEDLVFPIKINATDLNSISRIWWNLDNGVNYTYTSETHSTTINGYHTLYAFANDTYSNLNSTSFYFYAGNVQVNQTCPTNYTQFGSYENGTIRCVPQTPQYTYPCSGSQILLGNGTCVDLPTSSGTTTSTTTGGVVDLDEDSYEKPYVLLRWGIRFH